MNNDALAWPVSYTVTPHKKAKHVKLKISLHQGVRIVVPPRFNVKEIPSLLDQHKNWILQKLGELQKIKKTDEQVTLPNEIIFPAFQHCWKINYLQSHHKKLQLLARPHDDLVLFGKHFPFLECKKLLMRWLKIEAHKQLIPLLNNISAKMNLPYKTCQIRSQKTRWGSCSHHKHISLNYQLIFLPLHLLNYILIHELAHTVHLNHSPSFWRLVAEFDPQWKQHNKEARKAKHFIPDWIL